MKIVEISPETAREILNSINEGGDRYQPLGLFYLPLVPVYRASVKINRLIDLDWPVRLLRLGGNYSVVHGCGDGFCNLFVIGYRRPAADRTDHFRVARLVCYKQLAGSGEAAGGIPFHIELWYGGRQI